MKKVIALLLLAAMLTLSLASCSVDLTDMGAIIPMYLASPQTNLDPTRMIYDKDFVKTSALVFQTLTEIEENGDIDYVMIEEWEQKYDDERGEYFLYIDLTYSRWNDGRTFTADHVVYSWKRILSPEVASPAAALLYDVKNAKAVKAGLMTIDDLGVAAVDIDTLEVQLEKAIDPELFFEAISSPALVPLRDDAINNKENTWATNTNDLSTNGQFSVKEMEAQGAYRLDFSKYYRLPVEVEDGYNEFVKPYRLISDYSKTAEEALAAFQNGEIYYVGSFTNEGYESHKKDIESSDTMSSFTYFFDCENSVLKDARVRKALSLALSREEVASIIGQGSKAAEGFVSYNATGSGMNKSFRKEAGAVYSVTADVAAAQSLLSQAGVSGGSFSITYRSDRAYDQKISEYAKGVWEGLGFKVTLKGLALPAYEEALYGSDFDVIGLDYFGLSTNAYAALAPFAPSYSGSVVSVDANSSGIAPHVTGYSSDAYTALLDEILNETTRKGRNEKLIALEKLLAEDCPAVALSFYTNNYLASDELKDLDTNRYGYTVFTDATLKNYKEKNAAWEAQQEELMKNQSAK